MCGETPVVAHGDNSSPSERPPALAKSGRNPSIHRSKPLPLAWEPKATSETPKAKVKILTPPQSTHSCSSSCPGRGASRSWGFSGPLRHRSLAAPLAKRRLRSALFPPSPVAGGRLSPPALVLDTLPVLSLAGPLPAQQAGVGPGTGYRGRAPGAEGPRCQRGGGGAPGPASARRTHRAPWRLPPWGPGERALCRRGCPAGLRWLAAAALTPMCELLSDRLVRYY